MIWFPMFENMDQKTFLMIGGGKVAAGKAARLRRYFAQDLGNVPTGEKGRVCIRILAPETDIPVDAVYERCIPERQPEVSGSVWVEWLRKGYTPGDEELGDYVIAATDSKEMNAEIARRCHEKYIPVNVIDDQALCTWLFPSLIRRGDLMIGISTGGSSPAYASLLRRQIEEELPEDIDEILRRMNEVRQLLPSYLTEQKSRRTFLSQILCSMLAGEIPVELSAEELIGRYCVKTLDRVEE